MHIVTKAPSNLILVRLGRLSSVAQILFAMKIKFSYINRVTQILFNKYCERLGFTKMILAMTI